MNLSVNLRKVFSKPLRLPGILAWFNSALTIPYALVNARLLSKIISAAINGEVNQVLKFSLIELCFVLVYKAILSCLSFFGSLKSMKAIQQCKMILYSNILSSPLNLLFSSTNGSILENLTDDFQTVTSVYRTIYPELCTAILTSIIYSVFIGTQSFIIVVVLLILSLLQIIPPIIIRKYMQFNYNINREVEAKVTDITVIGYKGMSTIKLFSLEKWYLDKLKQVHVEAQYAGKRAELTGAAQASMNAFVNNLLKYGMYIAVGIIILNSLATIDVGIQAIALSAGLFGAIKSIFGCIPSLALVKKSEERLSRWFMCNDTEDRCYKNGNYALSLENISYQYDDSKNVLNNLNLHIKKNELVLIKGKNGSGKTTLMRIISGLLPLQHGTVTFGDDDNNDRLTFWGKYLFFLPQEDIVFDMPTTDLCKMLNCESSVFKFEEWGLSNSLLESSISSLSGGERKKVYLAIAFALNPKILILDEPSNSLDAEAKEKLCKNLLQRSGATLVISHDECLDVLTPNVYILDGGELKFEKSC